MEKVCNMPSQLLQKVSDKHSISLSRFEQISLNGFAFFQDELSLLLRLNEVATNV